MTGRVEPTETKKEKKELHSVSKFFYIGNFRFCPDILKNEALEEILTVILSV